MERSLESIVRAYATPLSILAAAALIALALARGPIVQGSIGPPDSLEEAVLPAAGVVLPIAWGDLGARLVASGVIDSDKLAALYERRGGFSEEYRALLTENAPKEIVMTPYNAGYLLNLLWAFGLANANEILEDSAEMMNPAYGRTSGFASTGGWTLAKDSAMNHYNRHVFVVLSQKQQALVDRVSRNIYRPCCNNSTHFPDCNHGMAMLGLLELMAAQGADDEKMYETALAVNAYWFPDTYLTIATYMKAKGIEWKNVSAQEMLGRDYSSATGYAAIAAQVRQSEQGGGGGCGA